MLSPFSMHILWVDIKNLLSLLFMFIAALRLCEIMVLRIKGVCPLFNKPFVSMLSIECIWKVEGIGMTFSMAALMG
jgi:hypothetical protein